MSTVAVQKEFSGRGNVQVGTGGLHGCTVVTLVSKRAVWMAHFWQGHACESYPPTRVDPQRCNLLPSNSALWI